MAQGPLINAAVKHLIATVYNDHPEWFAKQIRAEVEALWRKDNPDPKKSPRGWPGLSAVQKELAPIKARANMLHIRLDTHWHLASLVEYPIPPEALQVVLLAKVAQDTVERHKPVEIRHPLTIRQALWVARLYGLFHKWFEDEKKKAGDYSYPLMTLLDYAQKYAREEQVYEIQGIPFDSRELDDQLVYHLGREISQALGLPPPPPVIGIDVHLAPRPHAHLRRDAPLTAEQGADKERQEGQDSPAGGGPLNSPEAPQGPVNGETPPLER